MPKNHGYKKKVRINGSKVTLEFSRDNWDGDGKQHPGTWLKINAYNGKGFSYYGEEEITYKFKSYYKSRCKQIARVVKRCKNVNMIRNTLDKLLSS